jgi:hypothetical protein
MHPLRALRSHHLRGPVRQQRLREGGHCETEDALATMPAGDSIRARIGCGTKSPFRGLELVGSKSGVKSDCRLGGLVGDHLTAENASFQPRHPFVSTRRHPSDRSAGALS